MDPNSSIGSLDAEHLHRLVSWAQRYADVHVEGVATWTKELEGAKAAAAAEQGEAPPTPGNVEAQEGEAAAEEERKTGEGPLASDEPLIPNDVTESSSLSQTNGEEQGEEGSGSSVDDGGEDHGGGASTETSTHEEYATSEANDGQGASSNSEGGEGGEAGSKGSEEALLEGGGSQEGSEVHSGRDVVSPEAAAVETPGIGVAEGAQSEAAVLAEEAGSDAAAGE